MAGKRSAYGEARITAFTLWNGPRDIELVHDDEITFYGWNLLGLAARYPSYVSKELKLESRLAYANLFDESQAEVIVRGCWLDKEIMLGPLQNRSSELSVDIPGRFVAISRDEIEALLSQVVGIQVPIGAVSTSNDELQVRKLRVKEDYTLSTFEKTWQSDDQSHELLNAAWDRAWVALGQLLDDGPAIESKRIRESWLTDASPTGIVYASSKYDPNAFAWVVPDDR